MKHDQTLIESFHLMWGNFPEPVMLIHKNREIIAVNALCTSIGRTPGSRCIEQGALEAHAGCLANEALQQQKATYKKIVHGEKNIISYWLPIEGFPEYFIHFGVGLTIDY